MDDHMSSNDQSGNVGDVGGSLGDRDRNGRNRGGRVNTSAWLIGALLVIVAVFAGLRFTRVPTPTPTPTPTRPAPTVPAPTPAPTPTTPAPGVTDLDRSITKVEDAVTRKDWNAAERELSVLRTTWERLRTRITSQDTTKDISMFEAAVKKLEGNIKAKNEAGAKTDINELKTMAKKFKLAPTSGSTTG